MVSCRISGGVKQVLLDFSGWTSAHGIPHVGSATSRLLRWFWTFITIVSAILFTYQMYTLIYKYFSYHTMIKTKLYFDKLLFPTVTICSLNPVRVSALHSESGYSNLSATYLDDRLIDPTNDTLEHKLAVHAQETAKMLNFNYDHGVENEMTPDIGLYNTNFHDYGYSESDLFISCTYNTKDCLAGDLTEFFDPTYGTCFQFNKNRTTPLRLEHYVSTRAGPLYGLQLLIRTHQEDYLPFIPSVGVRVAVHTQESEPFMDAFGFNAAPGFSNSFGIRFVKTTRLGEPYGICNEGVSDPSHYYFAGHYTAEGCYRSCLQDYIYAGCHCYDPTLGNAAHNQLNESCSAGNIAEMTTHINCQDARRKEFNVIEQCDCPLSCGEESYGITISTAQWPSEVYSPSVCNRRDFNKKYFGTIDDCMEWYEQNTLFISAFFEKLNYQTVLEVSDYGWVTFLSEVGGQLGLWLGVSFITCVEFLSLSCLLCQYGRHRNEIPDNVEPSLETEWTDTENDDTGTVYSVLETERNGVAPAPTVAD